MTISCRLSRALALAAGLSAGIALGQTPLDDDAGVVQTVARISDFDGEVSYARGDDPDTWQPADRNVPMTLGDRVYTGGGSRLELELHGGDVIRLGSQTDLTALNLTEDTRQFALKSGVAFFRVPDLQPNELFEVDTPNAAVTFDRSGDYRLDVDADGNSRLTVRKGSATVAAGGGQVAVGADAGIRIEGLDAPRYEVVGLPEVDAWDRWAGERESRALRSHSRQYVSASVAGVADLDEYGQWSRLPEYGWVWTPSSVAVDWAPYRTGRWMWQDPWGWTWVSTEPWGWAPYHSGRWVFASSRWCWVPVAPSIQVVHYAPALVAFVGAGPGFTASVTVGGGGFVGWFPLAPRDPLIPWWGARNARVTQVTNVTYVNQTYVTVVNQTTFVSGRPVASGVITERTVVRQAEAAPVLRGPVPVAPTVASTRVSVRNETSSARPTAAMTARPVVARVAPPPAPQRFEEKLATIRQNGGAPVRASASPQSVQTRASVQVRPAAAPEGKVTLAATSGTTDKTAQRIEPVAAPKGRALATEARPVEPSAVLPTRSSAADRAVQERNDRPSAESRNPAPPAAQPQARQPRPPEEKRPDVEPPARETTRENAAPRTLPQSARPAPQEAPSQGSPLHATPRSQSAEPRERPTPQRKVDSPAPVPPSAEHPKQYARPQQENGPPRDSRAQEEHPKATPPPSEQPRAARQPGATTAPHPQAAAPHPQATARRPTPRPREPENEKGNGDEAPPAPRPTRPPGSTAGNGS